MYNGVILSGAFAAGIAKQRIFFFSIGVSQELG